MAIYDCENEEGRRERTSEPRMACSPLLFTSRQAHVIHQIDNSRKWGEFIALVGQTFSRRIKLPNGGAGDAIDLTIYASVSTRPRWKTNREMKKCVIKKVLRKRGKGGDNCRGDKS